MNSKIESPTSSDIRRIAIPKRRALAAHADVETLRLIRDALTNFTFSDLETSPDAAYAFELSLRRPVDLLIIDLEMPIIHGELLYDLIAKAYPHCHRENTFAPPVIFIAEKHRSHNLQALKRDARVKGILTRPFSIENLLTSVESILPRRDPQKPTEI